jgi:hypothetical protein
MRSLRYLKEIAALHPKADHRRIYYLSVGYEFPWEMTRALELALFRTFCVPSIAKILHDSRHFERAGQRRYDDTSIIIGAILKHGYDSEIGGAYLRRMNAIHAHFDISNNDYLYVLSTFIFVPAGFIQRYGWRKLHPNEALAAFHFWREVGQRMGIQNIPEEYTDFQAWSTDYELTHFRQNDASRAVGNATLEVFARWFPAPLQPAARAVVRAAIGEDMRHCFGMAPPPPGLTTAIDTALRLRAFALNFRPARRTPEFDIDKQWRSYPHGYTRKDIGPPSMLAKINRSRGEHD